MSALPAVSVPFVPPGVGNGLVLVVSIALLLLGAEVFTNGIEWLGQRFGISESATGSVLAAVGTALPETMIAVTAIARAQLGTGSQGAADEVGVGAILGAPFMLATIATCLVGASVLFFSGRREHGSLFQFDGTATRRDLSFFLVGYTLAVVAALIPDDGIAVGGESVATRPILLAIAVALVVLYVVYVSRSLEGGESVVEEGLEDLYLGDVLERGERPFRTVLFDGDLSGNPTRLLVVAQTALALGIIIVGAHLFVSGVEYLSTEVLRFPAAVVALLLAPLATELPEKLNSVLWISEDKDTLAIGNITGAMAFQGTLPVTLGIVFTSWNLTLAWGTAGFLNALSAVLALVSGGLLYLRARRGTSGVMRPAPFLIGGLFYLLFIVVTVYHVVAFDLSPGGH